MTAAAQRRPGRPRKPNSTKIATHDSRIYKFLTERLPHYLVNGRLNVDMLAGDLGMSPKTVYFWCHTDKITPESANKIVGISKDRLTLQDMVPYFLPAIR